MLLVAGEHDLAGVPESVDGLAALAPREHLGVWRYQVSGKSHFYEGNAPLVLTQATLPGGERNATLEAAMESFLADALARN